MRTTALALALLLACSACAGDDLHTEARRDIPRDARGDPVLAEIPLAPGTVAAPGTPAVKVQSCTHRRRCP